MYRNVNKYRITEMKSEIIKMRCIKRLSSPLDISKVESLEHWDFLIPILYQKCEKSQYKNSLNSEPTTKSLSGNVIFLKILCIPRVCL